MALHHHPPKLREALMRSAMRHKNSLGEGAKKRRGLKRPEKMEVVMREFHRGTLHSGSGGIVKNRKQAAAIAFAEARRRRTT